MGVGDRIQNRMKSLGMSQNKLAKTAQISQSGLSSIISGAVSPKENTLKAIASALQCSVSDLLNDSESVPPGFTRIVRKAVPVIGRIACGEPITAEQNIQGYADLPDGIRADFALRCNGDSMAPTFRNGDLVLVRQQPDVIDGQIAVVLRSGDATLKRVYHKQGSLLLVADNPAYPPMTIDLMDGEYTAIQGLAVGYTRMFNESR